MLTIGDVKRFTPPIPFNGPKGEIEIIKKEFGPNAEMISGVIALVTSNFRIELVEDNEKGCDCDNCKGAHRPRLDLSGFIHFPDEKIPKPEMLDVARSTFPETHNVLFLWERPAKQRGATNLLPDDDFNEIRMLWDEYGAQHGITADTGHGGITGGPASHHVFDFHIVMGMSTETDGNYGIWGMGMREFIPFDAEKHKKGAEESARKLSERINNNPGLNRQAMKLLKDTLDQNPDLKASLPRGMAKEIKRMFGDDDDDTPPPPKGGKGWN